jgi:hypothetical protein
MHSWDGLSDWFKSYHSKRQEHRHYDNIILFMICGYKILHDFPYILARCRDVMLPMRKSRGYVVYSQQ